MTDQSSNPNPRQDESQRETSDANQNAPVTQNRGSLHSANTKEIDTGTANSRIDSQHKKQAGKRNINWPIVLNVISTAVMAVATIALVVVAFYQLGAIKNQAKNTEDQVIQAKAATEETAKAVALAKRAQRPCILAVKPDDHELKPGDTIPVQITIKNYGQSPAHIRLGGAAAKFMEESLNMEQRLANIKSGGEGANYIRIIAPGGTDILPYPRPIAIPNDASEREMRNIYIVGHVMFTDLANESADLVFCFRYNPATRSFDPTSEGNSLEYESDKK